MKNILSKIGFIFVFVLSVITIGSLNFSPSNDEEVIRQVDIEYRTREEQLVSMLDSFDYYNFEKNNNHFEFDSEKLVNFDNGNNYEYLSDVESGVLKQKISTDYNLEQNVFTVKISYYDGDNIVSETTKETVPVYDEEKDDAYVIVNGDKYYFSETFDIDEFEQCVALVDDAVIIGGAVIVGAVALTLCAASSSVNYDVVTQVTYEVQTFFESVKSAICSFFSWFVRWIKVAVTRVVEKIVTVVTKIVTPAITVNNERVETKEISVSDIKNKEKNKYYLVFADTTNGKMYISNAIKKEIAIAILCFPIVVKCIGNSSVEMMASTYTVMRDDAYDIAYSAGINPRTPYGNPDYEHGFYHYHSIATAMVKTKNGSYETRSPHSFFFYY